MYPEFIISLPHGSLWFSISYQISILICVTVFLISAYKKGIPLSQVLLLTLSGVVFFIIGTKLFALSPGEWQSIFSQDVFNRPDKMTILGGLVGLLFGLWIAKRALKISFPVVDILAVAIPISMAFQRTGCLLAGCCHGKPTSLPWGISYADNYGVYRSSS